MHLQLHWLHLEKRICESSAFLQKCIYSYIGCFCKKNSQCQWSLASQENRIGFVGFGVCFDLLGPKFSIRAGRLKKGAGCASQGRRIASRQNSESFSSLFSIVSSCYFRNTSHQHSISGVRLNLSSGQR